MSTDDFALLSDRAIMFASVVYALALLAHVAEWARSMTRPVVATREEVTAGSRGGTALADVPPPSAPPSAEALERWELKIDSAGRIGVALTVVAAALHLVGVVARSFATDPVRVPWGNMYEFTVTGVLVVVVTYLALLRRLELRWLGLFVTAFAVVTMMCANLLLVQEAGPLVPALHSYWLVIHVGAAMVASGAFALGALASVVFLLKERGENHPASRLARLSRLFPSADSLDRFAYRVHAVGFPLWTFAVLIAGPVWAEYAWGSYWNWDPKEVWAFISWVCYAAYLHARATAGWKGRAAAMLALIGFASLLFNFVGINFFFGGGSMHSYAGG